MNVGSVRIGQYLVEIQLFEHVQYANILNILRKILKNIEKITFKIVQIKFLAMHITNQKWSFDTFMLRNLQNIFMEHDLYLIS